MATSTRVCSAVFLLSGVLAILAACDKESSPQPAPTPLTAAVARIEINGPRTVAPGETATFTARAILTDGSSRDVTSEARWRSNKLPFPDGWTRTVKAGGRGDVTITAELNRITSTVQVVVVPVGTYRLSGVVRVSNVAGGFVAGAQVQVLDGPERLETLTKRRASTLFGVRAPPRSESLAPATRPPSRPTADAAPVGGLFAVVVGGAAGLQRHLHAENQSGDAVRHLGPGARVSRPDLHRNDHANRALPRGQAHRRRDGRLVRQGRSLHRRRRAYRGRPSTSTKTSMADSYPEVVERVPSGTHIVVGGVASTKRVAEGLVGTLNGRSPCMPGGRDRLVPSVGCWSRDIRFALLK